MSYVTVDGLEIQVGSAEWRWWEETLRHPHLAPSRRREIVRIAEWGIAHQAQIHYAETRPIPVHQRPLTLPLTTDCSGWVTICYAWAGAPDPNGNHYNGYGFTGTLVLHGRQIPLRAVRPSDVVIYGGGPGHHAALVTEVLSSRLADIITSSHGNESGPYRISVADEAVDQPAGIRFFRFPVV